MLDEERPVMTGVVVEWDKAKRCWVAACDDPAAEERLVVTGVTQEEAERLLDERWRACLEEIDREAEDERTG
jgi:predicted RNase H-like HicB family nuclease